MPEIVQNRLVICLLLTLSATSPNVCYRHCAAAAYALIHETHYTFLETQGSKVGAKKSVETSGIKSARIDYFFADFFMPVSTFLRFYFRPNFCPTGSDFVIFDTRNLLYST